MISVDGAAEAGLDDAAGHRQGHRSEHVGCIEVAGRTSRAPPQALVGTGRTGGASERQSLSGLVSGPTGIEDPARDRATSDSGGSYQTTIRGFRKGMCTVAKAYRSTAFGSKAPGPYPPRRDRSRPPARRPRLAAVMAVIALVVSLVVTLGVTTVSTASSATAAPTARPGVPTKVSAAAGNGQATVSFGAPKDTGGQPITSYTVTATNQANPNASPVQVVGKTSPIIVKGMVNGVVWTITVAASNTAGLGPATNSSSVVIPTNHPELTPDPPTNVTAKAAPGQATISYTPPAKDNPNAPVYLYIATATDLTDPSKGGQTGIVDLGAGTAGSAPITVTGLTNGDLYTFTVISGNTGTNLPDEPTQGSAPSAPSAPVMPAAPSRPPGPPTKVSATAGNGEASVSFSAPEDNGGQPITSYTVTASSGLQVSGTTSPIVVLGLADRTTYTFTVTATNSVGTGPASVPSNPVVPSGPPGAPPGVPTKVSAAAGNSQATVSFSPPSATGGTPITFYTVTATNQANPNASHVQVVGKTSPIVVNGMANGVVWTITVAASNAAGQGPATNSSSVVIPTNHPELTPDPPTNVTAKAAPGQATISYTPPAKDNPNAPVYLYIATATDLTDPSKGGQTGIVDFGAGKTGSGPITVTGLTNGDLYTFTVISGNTGINLPDEPTQGSVPSDPSAPVIPAGPPSRPTIGPAVAGNGEASVSFSAPEDNGGQPIIAYRVTAASGQTATGSKSPIVVTGLSNGTSYTFSVTAVNDAGEARRRRSRTRSSPAAIRAPRVRRQTPTLPLETARHRCRSLRRSRTAALRSLALR